MTKLFAMSTYKMSWKKSNTGLFKYDIADFTSVCVVHSDLYTAGLDGFARTS